MGDDLQPLLVGAILAVVGTVVGATLNAWLSARAERARWRRDWTTGRIDALQNFFGETLEAVDDQYRVIHQCAEAVQNQRPPVPVERVYQADQRWSRVLARRGVSAPTEVQNAMAAYDEARSRAASAINALDPSEITPALASLQADRVIVLDAMKVVQDEMNDSLAMHLLPRTVIAWRRVRGHPLRDL
jgi:hypothetical protein